MHNASDVLKFMKDNDIRYVDLRFTDPRGKMQHLTMDAGMVDEDMFADGIMFDGSSIAGWKAINESDMTLMPDPEPPPAWIPFFASGYLGQSFCDVLEPLDRRSPIQSRSLASMAKKAHGAIMKSRRASATPPISVPEAEFFVFDDVQLFKADPYNTGFQLDSHANCPTNMDTPSTKAGNLGHRHRAPRAVISRFRRWIRVRTCARKCSMAMASDGRVETEKHHHEVASAQHELGMKFQDPRADLRRPDANLQILHPPGRPEPTARRRPSCPSPYTATTVRACMCTSRSGSPASRCSPATNTPT